MFGKVIIPFIFGTTNSTSLSGLLYQPNLNALLINIGIIITIYKLIYTKENKYYILYIFFAFAASLTSSRAGFLAILSVFVILFFANSYFALVLSKKEKTSLFILAALYIFIICYSQLVLGNSAISKFAYKGFLQDVSITKRFMIWTATILLWLNKPVLGSGLESFKFLNNLYQVKACKILNLPVDNVSYFVWAHNEMFQILQEIGIIIALPLTITIIFYFYSNLKKTKDIHNWLIPSLIIIFIVQSSLSWPLRHPLFLVLFFSILALIRNNKIYVLTKKTKNLFISAIAVFFIINTIYLFPTIVFDIKTSLKLREYRNKNEEKLELLYTAAKNPYCLSTVSINYLNIAIKNYMKLKYGTNHIPVYKEDFVKNELSNEELIKIKKLIKQINEISLLFSDKFKSYSTYYYMGVANMINNKPKEAKDYALKSISLNPSFEGAWILLRYCNKVLLSIKENRPLKNYFIKKEEGEKFLNNFINKNRIDSKL